MAKTTNTAKGGKAAALPKPSGTKAASPAQKAGLRAVMSPPPNIVALPIVRNAISAYEGAAEILPGTAADQARRRAGAMRREFLRLSELPPERLLDAYEPPARLKLSSSAGRAVSALLPEAGGQLWAREATGRIAALSLLMGEAAEVNVPAHGIRFRDTSGAPTSNREAKARAGAYLQAAREVMLTATDQNAAQAAGDSYSEWLAEWNRLNAQEIDGAANYRPALADLDKAKDDLEKVRKQLQDISAAAEPCCTDSH